MEGKDLTKGNLLKNMVILLIPLILTNLLNSIYNIVDSIWIGNLVGGTGVAAITNSYPITLILSSIMIGLATATAVSVSQYYGAKNEEKLKSTVGVSYLLSIILAIIAIAITRITLDFWLKLMNTPKDIYQVTVDYLSFYFIGYLFNFIFSIILHEYRAIGNTRAALIFVAISSGINIILDPLLIKAGLGVKGTAIATAISMFIGLVIAIIHINRKSKLLKFDLKYLKFNKSYIIQLIKLGIPMVIQELLIASVFFIEVNISNETGVVGSAGYGVVNKVEEVKKVIKEGLKISVIPILITIIIAFIFPKFFISLFVSSDDVISMAMSYINVLRISFLIIPIRHLLQGFVIGTGHTRFSMVQTLLAMSSQIISLIILRSATNLSGLVALGISITICAYVQVLVIIGYYFSNRWKKVVIKNKSIA